MRRIAEESLMMIKGGALGMYQVKDRHCKNEGPCFSFNCLEKGGYRQCENLIVVSATAFLSIGSGRLEKVSVGDKLCRIK